MFYVTKLSKESRARNNIENAESKHCAYDTVVELLWKVDICEMESIGRKICKRFI